MSVIIICGQTATGKSNLAVELALKHNGEIISADSRQVYCGLDKGSNKITASEMRDIPHYGLDLVAPGERFTVAQFQMYAREKIADILSRNKTVIIVGGTGLYIDATLFSRFSFGETKGSLDYATAEYFFDIPHRWIGLYASREYLVSQIHTRGAHHMTAVATEIQSLIDSGVSQDWLAGLGLEYRYGTALIQGSLTESEYIDLITTKTWQYARRQITWFKRNPRITWIDISKTNSDEII